MRRCTGSFCTGCSAVDSSSRLQYRRSMDSYQHAGVAAVVGNIGGCMPNTRPVDNNNCCCKAVVDSCYNYCIQL